jgi:hypothetical protein
VPWLAALSQQPNNWFDQVKLMQSLHHFDQPDDPYENQTTPVDAGLDTSGARGVWPIHWLTAVLVLVAFGLGEG